MDDLITKEVILEYSEGDLDAFRTVYEAYYPVAVNYARRMMRTFHIEDCRDAVQETFVNLFRLRRNFDCGQDFNPYFFRSLRNNLYKSLRGMMNEGRMKQELPPDCNLVIVDFGKDDPVKKIEGALDDLSLDQREAITLRYITGLKIQQIAGIIGVSENTVKTRIFYGLRKMKAVMQKEER